jgi:hypothetical protein
MKMEQIKKFKAIERISHKLKSIIEQTIEDHERYKKSFFWSPSRNASGRRYNENKFPMIPFDILRDDGILKVRPSYRETCGHCYYSLDIYLESPLFNEPSRVVLKKRNIRSLKNLLPK